MQLFTDFKEFALRGNVLDLAIGVIIGGAFGKIITSLVNDIIMPLIGVVVGNVDFTELTFTFTHGSDGREVVVAYGSFLTNVLDFVIIAFCIFIVIKQINRFVKKEKKKEEAVKGDPEDVVLLREIRDCLKKN
ncbi:MAG: large-conductance mechanosensitive channel protein MscL [Candidatus Paceibacterota bacterium]